MKQTGKNMLQKQTKRFAQLLKFSKYIAVFHMMSFAFSGVIAQEKQMIQVKTFSQQLQPMANVGVSINEGGFIFTNDKGVIFTELRDNDLPVKSITIKDEQLEVKAWNYSKSILEIIVRKKNFTLAKVTVKDQDNQAVPNLPVTFRGNKITNGTTDLNGKLEIPLAIDEKIHSANQFTAEGYDITGFQSSDQGNVLAVKQFKPTPSSQTPSKSDKSSVAENPITGKEYLKDFDFYKIDSIQSLTMFYAIFKNYEIKSLDEDIRKKIDAKFNELMAQLQDSVQENNATYMGMISDSSYVEEDIKNLLKQATAENLTLLFQRDEFDKKIKIIDAKLEKGIVNLDADTRATLYSDILELERLLRENESRFYKNLNYYREIIDSLKEKYFDFQSLESKLTESEIKRLEEQKLFRQRLLGISAVVLIFAILILLLIRFSNKLRKQKTALLKANAEIKRINENLEEIVQDRTRSLEESNRELDTFLYRASHDLRSPVCSIKGLCHIAANLSNGEPKELVERVVTTTEKMDKLLTKLSIISEINHPTEYASITFRNMIENVLQNFRDIIDEKQIDFQVDCPDDILFNSYPRLVEVVLTNLVENALHYGALKKTGTVTIELKANKVNDKIEFSIEDNGIGINESIRPHLFDMFFKGHETSKGNGLGLYIVQKSVVSLKGNISVESEKGKYTKFVVRLPLNLKPDEETLSVA